MNLLRVLCIVCHARKRPHMSPHLRSCFLYLHVFSCLDVLLLRFVHCLDLLQVLCSVWTSLFICPARLFAYERSWPERSVCYAG